MPHALQRLIVGDDPAAWSNAGFTVINNTVTLAKTSIELVGSSGPRGILGWALEDVTAEIDGLPTVILPEHNYLERSEHPNMVFAIDHVVVRTDNVENCVASFEAQGMDRRKVRSFTTDDREMQQSFFWAGRVIVELVGPAVPANDPKPTSFWGLALVSANLEHTASAIGDYLTEPKDAIQPGRKIATLKTCDLDISIPVAVMSPHVANLGD